MSNCGESPDQLVPWMSLTISRIRENRASVCHADFISPLITVCIFQRDLISVWHLNPSVLLLSSDKQRLLHLDRRAADTFQRGHQDSFWWASDMSRTCFSILFSFKTITWLCRRLSQVSWRWLWARWVVGSRLCCWRRWERCSEYRELSPGTGEWRAFSLCADRFRNVQIT